MQIIREFDIKGKCNTPGHEYKLIQDLINIRIRYLDDGYNSYHMSINWVYDVIYYIIVLKMEYCVTLILIKRR